MDVMKPYGYRRNPLKTNLSWEIVRNNRIGKPDIIAVCQFSVNVSIIVNSLNKTTDLIVDEEKINNA